MSLKVLYEDNHLIAVYKPPGVLVQGDSTGDPTIIDEVKYYLKQKYHKTGKVWLGLIHRLDRPVDGIVLLAKTSKGAARLSEQFRNHLVKKIYHALVIGEPLKSQDTLIHFLKKNSKSNKVTVYDHYVPGSQPAELSYAVVGKRGLSTMLKIKLATGRSHQIRAQLAAIGCPIAGDVKYGAAAVGSVQKLALTASSLTFTTATGDVSKTITIKPAWALEKEAALTAD